VATTLFIRALRPERSAPPDRRSGPLEGRRHLLSRESRGILLYDTREIGQH
jgi:hypothetical protein